MDKEAEDRMKALLPKVVRKLKFDFRAAAEQLSAQFGVVVEADWCRRAFAEAHKAAGSKPRPAHQQPVQARELPLPPSRSSAEPALSSSLSSSSRTREGLVKQNQGKALPHDDAMCMSIVQPEGRGEVGLADDTWSFSEWTKNHEAEQKKRQEQRKVLFERVLASMGGGSSESQAVSVPHDIRTAILERQAQEEKEEQEQESRRQQQWIDEQRAALKNRFSPGSVDDEGVDPLSGVNRHDDKDSNESGEAVQSNQELQADILLHAVLEGMEVDLDDLLTEVESAIGINGDNDNNGVVSELGEVLQFLEQTAAEQQRVQQKASTPTEPPAKIHERVVLEDDLGNAQRITLPTRAEHRGQGTTEAVSLEITPPAQIATAKVVSHQMRHSTNGQQFDSVLVNTRPLMEQAQAIRAQHDTPPNMSNKMGGIWAADTTEHAIRSRGNGNRTGRLYDGEQAVGAFNSDSNGDGDDDDDDDDEASWLQQRRQMRAAVQSYHVMQISSSTTTAAQSPLKRVTFEETVHDIDFAQPNVEEIHALNAFTSAGTREPVDQQGLEEVKETEKQAAEWEERREEDSNSIEEKPAVLATFSQIVATTTIPENVGGTKLVAQVTGSYFQSGTEANDLDQGNDERSDLRRNERMKASIQQAKERRLLALTQQQEQQRSQANANT